MRTITSLLTAGLLACSMSAIAADTATDGRSGDVAAADSSGNNNPVDRNNNAKATDDRGTGTAVQGRSSDIAGNNEGSVVRDGTRVGEYGNECAWGLANGKHVETNCAVNMTREDGKTYCFSSDKAMANFMKEPSRNMSKAKETYGRS